MKREFWHNTDEQVRDFIARAAGIVDELGLPDDIREAAFVQAVGLLSARQIVFEQVAPMGTIMRPQG